MLLTVFKPVPGVRDPRPLKGQKKDYSKILRTATLRQFIAEANSDGLVLNCLKLPESHAVSNNPLLGSGLDLEEVAFLKTNHLFDDADPLLADMRFWKILGTRHTLTIGHYDKAPTRATNEGPYSKLWIRRRPDIVQDQCGSWRHDIEKSSFFLNWDPDCPDTKHGRYEGVMLLPKRGTL